MGKPTGSRGGKGSNQYQTKAGGVMDTPRADTSDLARAADESSRVAKPSSLGLSRLEAPKRMNLENFSQSVMEFARNDPETRDSYDLDPPYQRGSVWSVTQQQNLVWSLLAGVPIGAVVTNERHPDHEAYDPVVWQAIVDGKQRITAIRAFVDSEVPVPAAWFAEDKYGEYIDRTCGPIDYDGSTVEGVLYKDLNSMGQGLFKRTTIGVCKGQVNTIAEEATMYNLVNFGGVAQTAADRERATQVAGSRPGE